MTMCGLFGFQLKKILGIEIIANGKNASLISCRFAVLVNTEQKVVALRILQFLFSKIKEAPKKARALFKKMATLG